MINDFDLKIDENDISDSLIAEIQNLAKIVRKNYKWITLECEPIFDVLKRKSVASDKTMFIIW